MKKRKMINFISTLLIIFTIGTVLTIPTYAITFKWSLSMSTNGRVVDGKKNDVYHKLSYGHVKIKGSVFTVSNKNIHSSQTNKLHFQLYNKTTGNCFGDVTTRPGACKLDKIYFEGIYSKKVGGGNKYYLYVWRTESDGTSLTAEGKAYHYDYK